MLYDYAATVLLDIYILRRREGEEHTQRKKENGNKIDSIKEFVLFDVKNLFDFINQIKWYRVELYVGTSIIIRYYWIGGGPKNISSINKWFFTNGWTVLYMEGW